MGHAAVTRNLGHNIRWKQATVQSLACALIKHERITTTHVRAKEAQRLAEKLVTLGKHGTLATRRQAIRLIQDPGLVRRLFSEIAPRFSKRNGGYTRLTHQGIRPGDGASLSVLAWSELGVPLSPQARPEGGAKERAKRGKATTQDSKAGAKKEEKQEKPRAPETPPQAQPEKGSEEKPEEKPRGFLEGLRRFFKKGKDKK